MVLGSLLGKRQRRPERGAARCQKRVGTVRPFKKTCGRSLGGCPRETTREPSGWVEGVKVTYRKAAVTPPPRAAGPRARGSYESSSPGSASRSRSASVFRPRRGRRATHTSTSGVTREETGRKRKSGWRRREPDQPALSQIRGGGPGEALAPPLKGPSAAGLRSCEVHRELHRWKRSKWVLQQRLRTRGRFSGFLWLYSWVLPTLEDRGQPPSHSLVSLADRTRQRRGATALIPSRLAVAKTEVLLYHAEVGWRGGRLGPAPALALLRCAFFPSNPLPSHA